MVYIPRISINCPPQIVANWINTPIADLFNGNNLNLRVQPETYTRIEEGEKSKFNDFFSGVGYQLAPIRVGFSVAIADRRDELLIALSELSRLSISAGYKYFAPINISDYCRLETIEDYTRGFAIRSGQIWVENRTAIVKRGRISCTESQGSSPIIVEHPIGGGYNNGFTLKFISSKQEILG